MAAAYPPLPELPIDAILEVCTHHSLGGTGYTNNSRLALIGLPYTTATVRHVLALTNSELSAIELENKGRRLLDNDCILRIVGAYDFGRKLRTAPEIRQAVLGSFPDLRNIMFAYFAAIVVHRGHDTFRQFIASLLPALQAYSTDPDADEHVGQQTAHGAGAPLGEAAIIVNPNAVNNVQLLNEAAQKGNFAVSYLAEAAGEPHAPLWTVRVRIDDTESSVASGVDKRSAKEAAAREALELLGLAYIN